MRERVRKVSLLASTSNMEIKILTRTLEVMGTNRMAITRVMMTDLMRDLSKLNGFNTRILKKHPYRVMYWTSTLLLHFKDRLPIRLKLDSIRLHQQRIVQNCQTKVRVSYGGRATAAASSPHTICTKRQISWILYSPREQFLIPTSTSGPLRSCVLLDTSLIMRKQSRK